MFFALGNALGFWSGAAATIVARVGIGDLTYGVALTLFTGAYLAAMSSAGAIAHRFTLQAHLDRRRSRRRADARRVCCWRRALSATSSCRAALAFSAAWSI